MRQRQKGKSKKEAVTHGKVQMEMSHEQKGVPYACNVEKEIYTLPSIYGERSLKTGRAHAVGGLG
jgi:hypothetical protein